VSEGTHYPYLEEFADRFCALMMQSVKEQVVLISESALCFSLTPPPTRPLVPSAFVCLCLCLCLCMCVCCVPFSLVSTTETNTSLCDAHVHVHVHEAHTMNRHADMDTDTNTENETL
jgi:hypothetical protein